MLVLLATTFVPAAAYAAPVPNGITDDPGYPKSDVTGKIIGSGGYTLATGYSVVSITMYANPVGGAAGSQATASWASGSWSANIPGLTSGAKYNVFTQIIVAKNLVPTPYATTPVTVTVK